MSIPFIRSLFASPALKYPKVCNIHQLVACPLMLKKMTPKKIERLVNATHIMAPQRKLLSNARCKKMSPIPYKISSGKANVPSIHHKS